jgi:hypothetical protein
VDPFLVEIAEVNRWRLQRMLPLMALLHAVHVAMFWPRAGHEYGAIELQWQTAVMTVHAATVVVAVALFVALQAHERASRVVAPLTALVYLLHAAAIVSVDQLNVTSVTPFIGYALGVAVIVSLSPAEAVALYLIGVAAFLYGITTWQADAVARGAILPNGPSISMVSVAIAVMLRSARRRDFDQRATIHAQRDELARLNGQLEERVAAQVKEIVQRAEELDRLNRHLQAQVIAQSAQLQAALSRTSARRNLDTFSLKGAVLGDRFEVGDLIGAGGMGAVYSAHDHATGEKVAVKVVQARSGSHLELLQRFVREAATAASVLHPGVVRMLHVAVEDGLFYQVQELVQGETLKDLLQRVKRCDPVVAARIGAELFDALAAAHERGVVHRDVKPANLMLVRTPPGLKLLDFGIARIDEDPSEGSLGTRTGAILGTPAFMPPEQIMGQQDISGRADVYAAGMTLYVAIAGRHPYDDSSLHAMIGHHTRGEVPDVRIHEPETPERLADLVARCLRRDPSLRPTAAEASAALEAFADAYDARPLDVLVREQALGAASMRGADTMVVD